MRSTKSVGNPSYSGKLYKPGFNLYQINILNSFSTFTVIENEDLTKDGESCIRVSNEIGNYSNGDMEILLLGNDNLRSRVRHKSYNWSSGGSNFHFEFEMTPTNWAGLSSVNMSSDIVTEQTDCDGDLFQWVIPKRIYWFYQVDTFIPNLSAGISEVDRPSVVTQCNQSARWSILVLINRDLIVDVVFTGNSAKTIVKLDEY